MSVWSVEQSNHCDVYVFLYIHNIYTNIYFYVLKMKFPICSFSCFVLARKTHLISHVDGIHCLHFLFCVTSVSL